MSLKRILESKSLINGTISLTNSNFNNAKAGSLFNQMIKVYILQLIEADYDSAYQESLFQYLPEAGKLRVHNRLNNTSKLHTVAGELLARYSIAQFSGNPDLKIKLKFGVKGKPHIENMENLHFNISHSGNYVVCAVGSSELGIDVERIRKVNLRIAERFFSPSEISDLMNKDEADRMHYFITLWTIKESYLKAIGRGLTQHLNSFTIIRSGESYQLTGNKRALGYGIITHQPDTEYMMAVCAPLPLSVSTINHISLAGIIKTLPSYI